MPKPISFQVIKPYLINHISKLKKAKTFISTILQNIRDDVDGGAILYSFFNFIKIKKKSKIMGLRQILYSRVI